MIQLQHTTLNTEPKLKYRANEDRDTRRRRRREDRSRRRPWWLCIVGGCAFRTERERERERRRLWWDWNLLVTEREKRCPSWWVWIGGGFRSSLCHGEDGGDAVRRKRIVVLRGGFRSTLCHGEEEKTITKPDGVSMVEDRCGGSMWRIGDGFESLVGFVSLRDGEHKVRGEERKKGKLKKKNFAYPVDTCL
ncbi:hypothetical protein F2Q68_00029915 [Brassica cretica]|uniref:Uncharacterized protein n=1 Tax=Brassica cretica TaxID=69181 RepID=A0A8S9G950_BRACR|nr:hypothetical protein F2Q68_00029915 [Brassica cretica]